MELRKLVAVFDELWPCTHAEDWDVVGLVSGNLNQQISKILLTVDVTAEIVEEAIAIKADLIFAHHPLLLKGINTLAEQTGKGSLLSKLIKHDIALFAAHTNADVQATGTSAVLAQHIGLKNTKVLAQAPSGVGIGIIGEVADHDLASLAGKLSKMLPSTATGVRVAGSYDQKVSTVALCAGAGDAYLQLALDSGADLYITSDLRHHPAQEILEQAKARELSFSLIDIPHWAAEYLWLAQAKTELATTGLDLVISEIRTDVFDFLVNLPGVDDASR